MNWFRDYLPEGQLVLDASVLINLLACGAANEVFSALSGPCLVEEKVFGEISRHPISGLCHVGALQSLASSGFIKQTSMEAEEYAHFLSLIQAPLGQRLDAGESATLAVAKGRGLSVVIDENKGRTYVAKNFPQVVVVSSLKLLISATVRLRRDVSYLQDRLNAARDHARMGVPRDEKLLFAEVTLANTSRTAETKA